MSFWRKIFGKKRSASHRATARASQLSTIMRSSSISPSTACLACRLSTQPGEKFDDYDRHVCTREIGALIAKMGDRGVFTMDGRTLPRAQLMTLVIHGVRKKMKDYRTSASLNLARDGIDGRGQMARL